MTAALLLLHLAALASFAIHWKAGLLAFAVLHLGLVAFTLWPGSTPLGPAVTRFPDHTRSLVLTIDDGPCPDTPAILDLLDRHHAKAVFFLIGRLAAARPDLVRAITARGHQLGNHTLTHPAKTFWAFPPARQRREILETSRILTEIAGSSPQWFRAPAGFRNPFTAPLLREAGLTYLGWTARGFDTRTSRLPAILRRLRRGFRPGGILLVHQGLPHSPALLDALLTELTADGWSTRLPPPPAGISPCVPPPSRGG